MVRTGRAFSTASACSGVLRPEIIVSGVDEKEQEATGVDHDAGMGIGDLLRVIRVP